MLSRSMQCKAEAWLVLTIHDRDKHILLLAATWLWWTLARQSTHSLSEKPFVLFIQYPPDEGRPLATSSLARSLRGLTYSTLKFIPRSTCGKSINTQRILIMTLKENPIRSDLSCRSYHKCFTGATGVQLGCCYCCRAGAFQESCQGPSIRSKKGRKWRKVVQTSLIQCQSKAAGSSSKYIRRFG